MDGTIILNQINCDQTIYSYVVVSPYTFKGFNFWDVGHENNSLRQGHEYFVQAIHVFRKVRYWKRTSRSFYTELITGESDLESVFLLNNRLPCTAALHVWPICI